MRHVDPHDAGGSCPDTGSIGTAIGTMDLLSRASASLLAWSSRSDLESARAVPEVHVHGGVFDPWGTDTRSGRGDPKVTPEGRHLGQSEAHSSNRRQSRSPRRSDPTERSTACHQRRWCRPGTLDDQPVGRPPRWIPSRARETLEREIPVQVIAWPTPAALHRPSPARTMLDRGRLTG
jgi:hypothetical protein